MNIILLGEDFCMESRYMRGVTEKTIERYRVNIRTFVKVTDVEDIGAVSQQTVFHFFMHGRVSRKWKSRTYHTYYQTLKVFFRWCVRKGHLTENYVEHIELPRREKLLPKRISLDDAYKLVETSFHYPYTQDFVRHRNHALFALFLYTGLRKSEALGLKMQDVNLEHFSIFVRMGKGRKDRVVPIPMSVAHILNRYLKERKKAKKTCPEFFTSSNRNCGFTENGLKHTVDLMRKATGIQFSPHMLRHTFATLMIEGGCDIYSLSKMMGHSDIKTTTVYLSASSEHLREQIVKHPMNTMLSSHHIHDWNIPVV